MAIKRKMTGETEVNEKEMEPHGMTDCATSKQILYTDKNEKECEVGGKIAPIRQVTQAE